MGETKSLVAEVVRRYHDDKDSMGYDRALALLEAYGLWAVDADNLLHPPKGK